MKDYSDYMLLLSPSDSVNEQVRQHKLNAALIIGDYESIHSKAHISIETYPRKKPFLTEPILLELGKQLKMVCPFTFSIAGFDIFHHGNNYRTIYAKISSTPASTTWFKQLKRHLKVNRFMVPHITIARNITIAQFNLLWPHYKNIEWNESFTVNGLTILKRETSAPFAQWQPFAVLPFNGKPQPVADAPKPSLLKPANSQQTSLF